MPSDRTWLLCAAIGLVVSLTGLACAQDEEEEQPYLPGLVATYIAADGSEVRRLDDAIAFDWQEQLPDPRISKAPHGVTWRGLLWARESGDYRLHVFVTGEVEVRLAGNVVIPRQRLKEAWTSSDPLPLEFDRHPLEVEFRQTEPAARIALFWSGPQFGLEPISPRFLLHAREKTIAADFERGRLLAAALRCAACHAGEVDGAAVMAAPSLANLGGNLNPTWLVGWLMESGLADESRQAARRMPHYGLSRDDSQAIAAYLIPPAKPAKSPKPANRSKATVQRSEKGKKSKGKENEPEPPSAQQGERLLLTLGCLACHKVGELGESGLFGGGDLTHVADKRPADFFRRWLEDPAKINSQHRMPVFGLTADERTSLSLFLATQSERKESGLSAIDTRLATRGRELALEHRCGACHELPGDPPRPAPIANVDLRGAVDLARSCAAAKSESKTGIGYALTPAQQRELKAYFGAATSRGGDVHADGEMLLVTNNCLVCHARDGFAAVNAALPAKLADKLAAVGEARSELAPLIPAMTPPSLNSVGDKLQDDALAAAIRRSGPAYRSYLHVQMPKFRFTDAELKAITDYFVAADRIPPGALTTPPPQTGEASALAAAGGRLVSTDGFGCVSCHQLGSVVPDKAPLNARGPALTQIDKRIRHEWFDRFVNDPSRIVPRMEMPSVKIPVKGVLGDKVDAQLAAVWRAVNTPGFEPPEPNPVRVLRTSGIAERKDPPIVINDVVKAGDRTFVHPLVIGLPNRQNFLYDLSEGRLAAWWLGDTARQRTKGKSWHWEPGGTMVMAAGSKGPELTLLREGKRLGPLPQGQHLAVLRGYDIDREQVQMSYSLVVGSAASANTIELHVTENWRVEPAASGTKTIRELTAMWTAEDGDRLVCELPPVTDGTIQIADRTWSQTQDGTATSRPLVAGESSAMLRVMYLPAAQPDVIDAPTLSFPVETDFVEVAPGFVGRRLPLPGDIMPTALAWRKQELVLGSLKGQVIAARDTDGDGMEDAASVVVDGLATPYGIADGGDGLHVLTKAALLEVKDGAANVLASGWGHTDDYHDWAVGLPRSEKGEYFVGLPCQQDERSAAAAKYRGAMLKLVPRLPTDDDPRRYDIEVVSTGHRFPMGLALNRDGELFVTDNQGNYNPFNELNHVKPGAFFGFINAVEKKDKSFKAPPLIEPAIDIPHPWTRSVNGICFLNSPPSSPGAFGPLEGHLVGCEYDTRRLVRMTLQKVDGTYQGAAYPLSLEPSSPEKGFLGPVVCAVSPRGELYVGSIRDSGWGAGNNIGEVVQVKIDPDKLPAGIAEVRANSGGFEIDFFHAVDAAKAGDAANYSISSYRRESTPAYGGPDLDRRIEKISSVNVAPDRRRATLKLPELREGFVYELQLKNLTADGSEFHPAEAHYTLRRKASD